MKNLAHNLSPQLVLELARLGKYDWLRTEVKDGKLEQIVTPSEHMGDNISRIVHEHMGTYLILNFNALSKLFAGGPKLLRPTLKQCEALVNTEARFRFTEYKQPYECILIELPQQLVTQLSAKYS